MEDKFGFEHEREVLDAFDKMKTDFDNSTSEGDIIRPDDRAVGDEILLETKKKDSSVTKRHTIFSRRAAKSDHPAAAGVIDKEEWDKMLKALEDKPVRQISEGEEAATVAATRASRASKYKNVDSAAERKLKREKKLAKRNAQIAAEDAKNAKRVANGKQPKKRSKAKTIFIRVLVALLALCMLCGIAGVVIVVKIIKETPEINPENIYSMLTQSSVIYDINGNIIDNIYADDALRNNVDYEDIPQQLIDAFVSIEDKTFFKHHGFNFIRIAGAVWYKVTGKSERIGGTSTITQQLARNIYLQDTKSARGLKGLVRKIREAYYTIEIERTLDKEKILEAYLNTVYLGFNSNGIETAARAYFNKELKDLTLNECAMLAALPQSPNNYAPLKRASTASLSEEQLNSLDIVTKNDEYTTYYNDAGDSRRQLVLYYMHDQEKIDDAIYEENKTASIRDSLNPGVNIGNAANDSSYINDYITAQVLADLQSKAGYSYNDAHDLLYKGGLIVNSTLDMDVQIKVEQTFSDPNNFPKINMNSLNLDANKNIMNSDGSKIIVYSKEKLFSKEGDFVLNKGEYKWEDNGNLIVYKGNRLNIYKTSVGGNIDYSVEFKDMYEVTDGVFYTRAGGVWNIPSEYKDRDSDGNLILYADYFNKYPEAFTQGDKGTLTLSSAYFTLKSPIIQPQSAMVVIENETGYLTAMMGGRGITGKLLYNRATATRQPGSSIKPLAIYSTALRLGKQNAQLKAEGVETAGAIFTASYTVDNIPSNVSYSLWPKNFDGTWKGITTIRKAVEQSLNACAVNLYLQMDPEECVTNLLNYGLTTLVLPEDIEDPITDKNASSLALGGMIKGVTPLEMASAYSTFGNYGEHIETICYTTVTTRTGEVVLNNEQKKTQVLDEDVSSLMLNILQSTVEQGIAGGAKLESQPSAGKTGTTSEMYDLWFCGLTPKYTASVWLGCDTNITIGSDSSKATKLWKAAMEKIGALDQRSEFEMRGEFVEVAIDKNTGMLPTEFTDEELDLKNEIFIKGTEPTDSGELGWHYVPVCAQTGYLATPYCGSTILKLCLDRPGGVSWENLLASYTLLVDPKDPEIPVSEWEEVDKTEFVNIVEGSELDPPQFYCPVHNYGEVQMYDDEGNELEEPIELYPVSPFSGQHEGNSFSIYDGEWVIDEMGNAVWVPYTQEQKDAIEQAMLEGLEQSGLEATAE